MDVCRVLEIYLHLVYMLNDPITVCQEQKTQSSMLRPVFLRIKNILNNFEIVIQNYHQIPVQSILCPQGLNETTASFSSHILQVNISVLASVSVRSTFPGHAAASLFVASAVFRFLFEIPSKDGSTLD